ncbi:MAG: hypothetical protein ACFNUF_06160, partial [Tannerella sp.]
RLQWHKNPVLGDCNVCNGIKTRFVALHDVREVKLGTFLARVRRVNPLPAPPKRDINGRRKA